MIEWILTDNNLNYLISALCLLSAIFIFSAIIIAFYASDSELTYETRKRIAMICTALFALSLFSAAYIEKNTASENVTEGDWVQIYSNDLKADISIYFSPTSYIKAGEELDSFSLNKLKTICNRNEIKDVAVAASKDGAEERRVVKMDGRNISIPSDEYTNLKITKIEYQKIVGQRKTLFGHTGDLSKSYLDGQIKITVDGEKKDESLKELFDGKKQ